MLYTLRSVVSQQTLYTQYLFFIPTPMFIRFMLLLIRILLIRFALLLVHILLTHFMFMLIHTCVFILKLMLILSSLLMIRTFVPIRERNPRDSLTWVPYMLKHKHAYIRHSSTYTFLFSNSCIP
ncbi:hypothetical protein HanRHA438_Chr01g0025541 [Helianthus annuus]|nr:hypothetical protein HanRHA438_Chr01g0025541 [Helianthus annuus]